MTQATIRRSGNRLTMPGLATAHSHAFQRALRGRTQRAATAANSFWSWRGLMYQLAETLDPDDIFNISRFAFVELAMQGVTAVGEFHYIHHTPDGTPYDDRLALAEAVIEAAREAGLRITLIRTAYMRGGYQQPLAAAQRRFSDGDAADVLHDVAALQQRYADAPGVRVALAAHSIRAVTRQALSQLASYARANGLRFHMHVAEQQREITESVSEFGLRPVQVLAEDGLLDANFVGVHCTHLADDEIMALGAAKAAVCLCRSTERDLGDGLPAISELLQAGAQLCVGVDSHASPDAFEELRAVEYDERSRLEARHTTLSAAGLLDAGTRGGYAAIGWDDAWLDDHVALDANDPSVAAVADEMLDDVVVFGGTPRAVRDVTVAGKTIVKDGWAVNYDAALTGYRQTLKKLGLLP